ncbi:MAG: hypothetical protein AB1640_11210 [bacterium]
MKSILKGPSRAIVSRAPARIDLAGGTVDIWPLYLFHSRAVTLNAAVGLSVRVRLVLAPGAGIRLEDGSTRAGRSWKSVGEMSRQRGLELYCRALEHFGIEDGLRIETTSDIPRGAGLAGSSALLVALCGALCKLTGLRLARESLVPLLRDIETRLIRVPAGLQDYYPALYGGVQALWWEAGRTRRERMLCSTKRLEERLLLVYTGVSRYSGANNWEVFKRHLDGSRPVRGSMQQIVEAARELHAALSQGDFCGAGAAMAREARARRRLFPGISTPLVQRLERELMRLGAGAVKVCGAGGGGCVLVYAEPEVKSSLMAVIRKRGLEVLPLRIANRGWVLHTEMALP